MTFITPKLEVLDASKKRFRLLEDWELSRGIIIPKGFITDLASIPSIIFWLQWGKWNFAAIIHDWLYINRFLMFKSPTPESIGQKDNNESIFYEYQFLTRQQADLLFFDLMLEFGVNYLTAYLMFAAVRLFGAKYWNQT